ncbi:MULTISPECIES: helix-turn-helix domain-containing protein [Micrococcaceae]|uniref:GlxA family transcriptional regulator n=1 Tax=Micrococcaceae TaxID=1268 RepID=UPI00027DFA76|nr:MULTISPECIES: helix-turn-helix domain-containing protein [Micrococcaceae]AFR28057.1 transcriptional regulator [Arthrobacter sp. Rue61a]MBP2267000.1 transcriptional regulator GlxA family with amidase domain [Pseudarthrobacter sp. PvP004]
MIKKLVVIVLFDNVDLLDVTGPPEVFALAKRENDEAASYEVVLAAETLVPVTTGAGVRVVPDVTFEDLGRRRIQTLIVPGAVEFDTNRQIRPVVHAAVVDRVKQLTGRADRVASICVGAHILAAAGLLDGIRATTHWSTAEQLAAEHPLVDVDPDPIFIRQGRVWTGAGISACLDLTLALIAEDLGEETALRVARQLVMYLKRPSGQSQFSVPLARTSTNRRIEDLRHYILRNVAQTLTIGKLADIANISERQVTRIFKNELGMTPHSYIESVRVEVARGYLESTDATLERIASVCGLGSIDTLVRAFRRRLNTTPTEYRLRFQT